MHFEHIKPQRIGGTMYCKHCNLAWGVGGIAPSCRPAPPSLFLALVELVWPMIIGGLAGYALGVLL